MKLNLNPDFINFYWKKLDVKFAQFLKEVGELETWTLTGDSEFQIKLRHFVLEYKEKNSKNYNANDDKIIQLMMYMNIAQFAYFLHILEESIPGISLNYIMDARQKERCEASKLLLNRLKIIEEFNYLQSIFAPAKARLISKILEDEECKRNS